MLQHPQHGPALAVADGVEELAYFRRVGNLLLDGMRVLQAVQVERPVGVHVYELRPHRPLGEQPVHRLGSHPGRETLVQPQVVPPLHGHEIAEPHVRHLVGDHLRHPLPRARRRVLRVHQQRRLPVCDAAPVFHGAGCKVRNRQVVQLGQRVGDSKVIVEKRQQLDRGVQRELSLLLLPACHPHTHSRAVGRLFLDVRQVADHKRQQIGRHHRRRAEKQGFQAVAGARFLDDRRVGNRLHFLRHVQRHLEGRLGRRLIPAGQGPPRVRGLKLRGGQVRGLSFGVRVLAAIEPPQLVIQLAGERHPQVLVTHQAICRGNRYADRRGFRVSVVCDVAGCVFLCAVGIGPTDGRRVYLDLRAVEHDIRRSGFHAHRHVHLAGECEIAEIRR